MSYIGVQPTAGNYRKLDDISSGFNGSTTAFTTSVGGVNVTAGSDQQLLVSVNNVIKSPGVDYSVSTNTITFTTAPTGGQSFFAILMGDALNTAVPSDGSITTSKLGTGLTVDLTSGSASTPALTFDANTGLYSPGEDQVAVTTGGTQRVSVDASGDVTVAGGNVTLNAQGDLRFADSDSSNWVAFQSPSTVSSNVTWTLPSADGTSGQVLSTNGTGTLSWTTAGSGDVTLTGIQTLTNKTLTDPAIIGTILEDVYTISDGAAFEIDPGNGSVQLITLGASRTPKATNFAAGESVTLMVDDGTAYTLTWTDSTFGGSGVVWKTDAGVAPTLNTTGYTVIVLWKVSTQVYGARVGNA